MKKSSWLLCLVALSLGCIAWTQAGAGQGGDPIDAVKRNAPDALRALIARAADIDAMDADSSTALHWAVQRDDVDMASLLLDAGADPAARTRYNITPLSLAAANGSAAMIERLLDAGVDANGTSHEGQTALMTAPIPDRAVVDRTYNGSV